MKRLLKTISKVVILAFITTNLIIPYNAANAESTSIASQIVNYSGNSKKEILVKFKDAGKSESIKKGLKKKLKLSKLDLKKKSRHRGIELLEIDNTDDMNKVLGELNSNSEVEYAQPNYLLSLLTVDNTATPASISVQSNVNTIINQQNPNISTSSGITIEKDKEKDMKKKDKKDKGSDVVVGIIDTGIDINNLELKDSIYQNIKEIPGNGLDDDKNGYIDDVNGWDFSNNDNTVYDSSTDDQHGTHVAGIIAASQNYGGITGVDPNARILPLKFISGRSGYTADAIEAIDYAEDMGVKIVNCSWGGTENNPALKDAIDNSGILFVCAAGNNQLNTDINPIFPASYDSSNIISVASVSKDGNLSSFSNYGPNTVDVAAPGENITSTLPGNTYGQMSGTSMAAPYVTGEAALLLGQNSKLDVPTLEEKLLNQVLTSPQLSSKVKTGGYFGSYSNNALLNTRSIQTNQGNGNETSNNTVNPDTILPFDGTNQVLNLDFNGSNNVSLGNASSLKPSNDMTIAMWVKPGSTQSTYSDIISCHGGSGGCGYVIEQDSSNTNKFYFAYWNGSSWQVTGAVQLTPNAWQHIVVEKTGNTIKFIVNGQTLSTRSCSGDIQYGQQDVYLSAWAEYPGIRHFNGSMDEIGIWNRALSDSEIQNVMNSGAYIISNGNVGLWKNNTGIREVLNLDFNGSNNVSLGNASSLKASKDMTITMWVKPGSTQTAYSDIMSCHGSGDGYDIEQDNNNTNKFYFGYWNGLNWQLTDSVQLTPNTWQHIAIVKSGNTLKFIVNGQTLSTKNCSGDIRYGQYSVYLSAWALYPDTRHFNGSIDDIGIWNRALSDSEIQNVMDSGANTINNGNVGVWRSSTGKRYLDALKDYYRINGYQYSIGVSFDSSFNSWLESNYTNLDASLCVPYKFYIDNVYGKDPNYPTYSSWILLFGYTYAGTGNDDGITIDFSSTPLSSSLINDAVFPPRTLPDGTPITAENRANELTENYYKTYIYPTDREEHPGTPFWTLLDAWEEDTYGENWLEKFWGAVEGLGLGIADAVESAYDGISYMLHHPIKTSEGLWFMYKGMHPHDYPVESALLANLTQLAIQNCWDDFTEGNSEKKGRMIGRLVGEIVLAIVSDKGASAAVEALQDTGKFSRIISEVGKGTITADDAVDIYRVAGAIGEGPVRTSQLKYALGRKGMSISKYEIEYVPEILGPDGDPVYAQMSQIGNDVLRGASGKPIIKITDRGLSSMEEAVKSVFHEIHHIETFLQRGFVSEEAHAESFAEQMLQRFIS